MRAVFDGIILSNTGLKIFILENRVQKRAGFKINTIVKNGIFKIYDELTNRKFK